MTRKDIITELEKGTQYGNHNTGFIFTADQEMIMCEYCRDCKYTIYRDIKKFANRILKFTKIGY